MGFFDLQVNGYAGVDFNSDELDQERLEAVCKRLLEQGVDGILATVITDSLPQMEHRLKRIAQLHSVSPLIRQVIKGIHIEGPFLNPSPGFRGAHPADAIQPATEENASRLLEAAGGLTKLVTLAPEQDPTGRVIRMLSDQKITVSAGHTDATLDQLKRSIDSGLSMFTHLGNGCPGTLARHDNIIQRALALHDKLWLCFIADGAHIPFFVLKNYLDLAGVEKSLVVTDAILAADLGPGNYRFGIWDLSIGEDLVPRSPDNSHLVGSAITMPRSFKNLCQHVGLTTEQAQLLLEINPKKTVPLQ
ncbi:N-acetylglucosamine-6-phosphate deacetylase [Edaphobacter albus]|uniref:N-acetylglucosamine-6-phosphate deacetylase n=1 Tax=Edaphobacter sp. 4G125 TaxID=2763071 RepID=UPI0016483D1F|nr:N-acetylglucosamine-6-phosphate deacetylase [Edaphobacter sp. 4G125]QNI35786.1 N-acetylglucosamine-6-phosphate deacetylase [Edaphobacter sp. 4G125]